MTRVKNGPARNTPKGTTSARLVPLDPTQCLCPTGPVTVATFRNEGLVEVEMRHLRTNGCGMPTFHVDPLDYTADLPMRGR